MDLGCVYFFTDEIFNEQEKPLRQFKALKSQVIEETQRKLLSVSLRWLGDLRNQD